MSLVTDSRVHSPSSDGFAAYLDAELDSDSSDVSPEQEAEDDEQEAEDESDSEYKRFSVGCIDLLLKYDCFT